jgi:XTP/dITP diphosphohydrolase
VVAVAFVTSNRGKFREARALLAPYGVRLSWVRRTLPELQSDDLAEVARSKSAAIRGRRGWVLVEDSGLFVASLHGFPGVYSAHFLRLWGFPPILELLRKRPREAAFRCVAVLRHGTDRRTFAGEVRGSIARRPAGRHGFGYDPIFVPTGYRRTFAELPARTKNSLSHRGRALRQVGAFLARRSRGKRRRASTRPGRRVSPDGRRPARAVISRRP